MESTLEVLPSGGRSRQNRKWPDDVKTRIVAETLLPGASVNDVHVGMVCLRTTFPRGGRWRGRGGWFCQRRRVRSSLRALMLGPADDAPGVVASAAMGPEILTGAVVIRLEAGASAERIASVVRALAAGA